MKLTFSHVSSLGLESCALCPRRLDGLRNVVYFSLKPQQREGDPHYCWSNRAIKCAP